ncbi:MAG: glycosyltransferase family 39 protein [Terriglobales bacterium]
MNAAGRRGVGLESTLLVLLIASSFVLRLWSLSEVRGWDEAVYLQNAEVICCDKANYSELDSRPPLLSILFAAVFKIWNHVYAACILAALLNALAPAFLYFSGRMITGRLPAALAALLLAFSPFFVGVFPAGFYSDATGNGLLSDSPALTLIVLAFWLLLRALRKQTDLRFACAGFVLALAILMRFASLSTVGLLSLLVLAANRWWRAALACGLGIATGLAPYLCWSRLRYGGFLTTFRRGWVNFDGPGESPFYYVKNFGNIFSWITLAGLALWIAHWAWETSKRRAPGDRDSGIDPNVQISRRMQYFLWFWALTLFIFFSSLRHKEPRYIMPAAPPLFLLAGIGLSALVQGRQTATQRTIRQTVRWPIQWAGTALLAGALAYTFLPDRHRFDDPFVDDEESEEMQVSDFLTHTVPPSTLLYSNFNYPVFGWLTNLTIHRLPESGPALYDALSHLPSNGILIAYKPNDEITEPRPEWLDSNPHFRRFHDFPGLVLYEYQK